MQCHLLFMFIMTLSCIFLPTGTFGVSASKGFIVAGSDGGLSNRLRALVAYMHVAKVKYDNAELGNLYLLNHIIHSFGVFISFLYSLSLRSVRMGCKRSLSRSFLGDISTSRWCYFHQECFAFIL